MHHHRLLLLVACLGAHHRHLEVCLARRAVIRNPREVDLALHRRLETCLLVPLLRLGECRLPSLLLLLAACLLLVAQVLWNLLRRHPRRSEVCRLLSLRRHPRRSEVCRPLKVVVHLGRLDRHLLLSGVCLLPKAVVRLARLDHLRLAVCRPANPLHLLVACHLLKAVDPLIRHRRLLGVCLPTSRRRPLVACLAQNLLRLSAACQGRKVPVHSAAHRARNPPHLSVACQGRRAPALLGACRLGSRLLLSETTRPVAA